MRPIALWLILLASVGQADPFRPMTGEQILAVFKDARLEYSAQAWQEFRSSGRTLYNAGHDSWGYWAVRGDQYCSQWPPSDLWACYDMARAGDMIRFVGAAGDVIDGRLKAK